VPRLRRFSGEEVIGILAGFGFLIHSQRGSHVKLRRASVSGAVQTMTIPRHRELDVGTPSRPYSARHAVSSPKRG